MCKSYAIPGDKRNYIEDILGIGNVTRPCPPGTLYNEGECMCSDMDNNPPSSFDGKLLYSVLLLSRDIDFWRTKTQQEFINSESNVQY